MNTDQLFLIFLPSRAALEMKDLSFNVIDDHPGDEVESLVWDWLLSGES